jgi:hypothetical protein
VLCAVKPPMPKEEAGAGALPNGVLPKELGGPPVIPKGEVLLAVLVKGVAAVLGALPNKLPPPLMSAPNAGDGTGLLPKSPTAGEEVTPKPLLDCDVDPKGPEVELGGGAELPNTVVDGAIAGTPNPNPNGEGPGAPNGAVARTPNGNDVFP